MYQMTTGARELSEIFQSCVFLCLLGNFATTTSWRRLPNVPPLAPSPRDINGVPDGQPPRGNACFRFPCS